MFYKERFGQPFLLTKGAVFIYLASILCLVILLTVDSPLPFIDELHNILTFQSKDWSSGLTYLALILVGIGWWVNVKESTSGWGFLTTIVQLAIGVATAFLVVLVALLFLASKSKK